MKEKCTFNGNRMQPCDNLSSVIFETNGNKMGLTFRHVANLNSEEDYVNGVILKYGNTKKSMVVISYCPACGENIEPR